MDWRTLKARKEAAAKKKEARKSVKGQFRRLLSGITTDPGSARRAGMAACDRLWSIAVRMKTNGRCWYCMNRRGRPSVPAVNSHHIFSRRHIATRHDLDNGVPLCFYCHTTIAHQDPAIFLDAVRELLGEAKYNALKHRSLLTEKADLKLVRMYLEGEIKRMEEHGGTKHSQGDNAQKL